MRPARGESRPQQARDLARQPVVGEEEVVGNPVAAGQLRDPSGERRDVAKKRVLVDALARGQIEHARERGKLLHGGIVRRLAAGEDVGGDAAVAEGGCDLPHVDVETAVCVLAQGGGRRGVHGDDRDPPSGAVTEQPVGLSHGTPISRQASASRRSRSRNERPANRNPLHLKTYDLSRYSRRTGPLGPWI